MPQTPAEGPPLIATGVKHETPQRAGPQMDDRFRQLDERENLPRAQMARAQDLMPVIPSRLIRFDELALHALLVEAGPAMRRDIHGVEQVRVIEDELLQRPPIIAEGFLLEADDMTDHGENAVFSQQPDGLQIVACGRALADLGDGIRIGRFHAHQHAIYSGAFIEMQEFGVAHDVRRANGGKQLHRQVLCDQCFQEFSPNPLG